MNLTIEVEREDDGRWLAEVVQLPGVLVYADARQEPISKAQALAPRVIADRLDHGESIPELDAVFRCLHEPLWSRQSPQSAS